MNKKLRLTIFIICLVLFITIAPMIVFYSVGYRFDTKKLKVVSTGGIYVRTFPAADQIIIDEVNAEKPGFFSNSIFIQNLIPDNHTISILKEGYFDYFKTLLVTERAVTKLENVYLFKKDIIFTKLEEGTDSPFIKENEKFILKSGGVYYSDTPENLQLDKKIPLVKDTLTFKVSGNKMTWLATDGSLYESDINNLPLKKESTLQLLGKEKLQISKLGTHEIIPNGQDIFINTNGYLVWYNRKTDSFKDIASSVKKAVMSPDSKHLIYSSENKIFIFLLSEAENITEGKEMQYLIYESKKTIQNLQWMNNYYIVFTLENNIVISEIDYRGEINIAELPDMLSLSDGKNIIIKSPEIIFNKQNNNLYISTEDMIFESEKLLQ